MKARRKRAKRKQRLQKQKLSRRNRLETRKGNTNTTKVQEIAGAAAEKPAEAPAEEQPGDVPAAEVNPPPSTVAQPAKPADMEAGWGVS